MDDFHEDLIAAIDDAPTHSENRYWSWTPETRAEYKAYYTAKQARSRPATVAEEPPAFEEEAAEAEEAEEAEEDDDTERAEPRTDVEPDIEEPKKKEPSRWVQYQQIARSELREQTNRSKIPLKEVNELARKMYREDGWGE